jgi:hypothetical protein
MLAQGVTLSDWFLGQHTTLAEFFWALGGHSRQIHPCQANESMIFSLHIFSSLLFIKHPVTERIVFFSY